MAQKSEAMKQEIEATREEMTEKVAAIESRVRGSVDEQVGAVKDALDVERIVRERPWAAVGAAIVAGYALGGLAASERTRRVGRAWGHEIGQAVAGMEHGMEQTLAAVEYKVGEVPDALRMVRDAAERVPERIPRPVAGAASRLADRLADELDLLEAAALTLVSDRVHEWLRRNAPSLASAYEGLGGLGQRGNGQRART